MLSSRLLPYRPPFPAAPACRACETFLKPVHSRLCQQLVGAPTLGTECAFLSARVSRSTAGVDTTCGLAHMDKCASDLNSQNVRSRAQDLLGNGPLGARAAVFSSRQAPSARVNWSLTAGESGASGRGGNAGAPAERASSLSGADLGPGHSGRQAAGRFGLAGNQHGGFPVLVFLVRVFLLSCQANRPALRALHCLTCPKAPDGEQ